MAQFTKEQLNEMSTTEKDSLILSLEDKVDHLTAEYEHLIELIRIADQQRFGRHTEKLNQIDGQLSLFNETEFYSDLNKEDPGLDDVIQKKPRKTRKSGQRDVDLKDFPTESYAHTVSENELNDIYGEGCWRKVDVEVYKRLRYEPASWTVEVHSVDVFVGTDGLNQDVFTRGEHPKSLFRNSIATSSLVSAIINAKYTNALPLERIQKEFECNGLNLSKQTMSNWMMKTSEIYFCHLWERMKEELLMQPVNQADETPLQVIHDNNPNDPDDRKGSPGHKNWMWLHRSGEFEEDNPIVLFEYQRTRHHKYPEEFYKNYKGILMTDGLEQYHILDREIPDLKNANCFVHARRAFTDAVKAMDRSDPEAARSSIAYQALLRIGQLYDLEKGFKKMTAEERLKARQTSSAPLVDEFFAWLKTIMRMRCLPPKSKTAKGVTYCLNQEEYLRVFLTDGNVPIDNSAAERAIRPFTVGRKNWVIMNTPRGAESSAVMYSIVETAKLNHLKPYYYLKHLLTVMPEQMDEKGNIDTLKLDKILPWSKELPEECYKKIVAE